MMMTKVNFISFVLWSLGFISASAASFGADSTQLPLQLFTSYEGAFSIKTPTAFTEKVDSFETPIGKLIYHTFYGTTTGEQSDNQVYMVSYCDYPAGAFPKDSIDLLNEFFNATTEEAASSVRGDIIYAADIQIQGNPGKIWRISYLNEKAVIKTKACMVGDRYYSIQVASQKEKSLNNLADRFLDSFYLFAPVPNKNR